MYKFRGWMIVAVCMLFQAVHWGLGSYSFTLWVLPWMQEFDATRAQIMMAPSMTILVMGLLSPLVGWAADRFPMRNLVCGGAALFTLAFVLTSQATALWQIVLVYALIVATGEAMAGPMMAQILTGKWFTRRRGLALGISATGISVGGVLFPPLAASLLVSYGWRDAQLFLSAIPLLLVVPLAWVLIGTASTSPSPAPEPSKPRHDPEQRAWTVGQILRDPGFVILALAIIPPNIVVYGVIQNLVPFAHDMGFDVKTSAVFMSILSIFMLLGKVLFGIAADYVQKRLVYCISMAGVGTSLLIFTVGLDNFYAMAANCALAGFSMGGGMPLMAAMVGVRFGARSMGQAMGLLYPFIAFCSVGPVLTGWIRDVTGSYAEAFFAYAAALVPAMILIAFFPERQGRDAAEESGQSL
jgi:MFS family permease